jgi:3-oxoadipate enol-lactonase
MKAAIIGLTLAYDDHGVGWPLIFLHAFPLNRGMWSGELTALLPLGRYRLVSLDWRGFGESEIGSDISTMDLLADDVAGLMDMLGMQDAILCGLSMGGYVTFAFLRKYPERVRGLILADTRPGADTAEAQANREHVARLAETDGPDAIADLQIPRLITAGTRQERPDVEVSIRQMINAATPQGIAAASRGMARRADSSDLLAAIAVPTLVIVGEQDELTTPTVAREYAARIPHAQYIVIPRAGHLSNLEQPAAFLQAISGFLAASFT